MKHIFYGLFLTLTLSANCKNTNTYQITGTWADGNGKTVYLCQMTEEKQLVRIDSAVVKNGTFEMTGPFDQIDRRVLLIENARINVLLDGQPIQVSITKQEDPKAIIAAGSQYDVKLSGSREQAVFERWTRIGRMAFTMAPTFSDKDGEELEDWQKNIKETYEKHVRYFLDSCYNSMAFTYLITDGLVTTAEEMENMYNKFTPEVKASYPGQLLAKKIESLRLVSEGQIAPEIELPTPDGTLVKLSSLRGKYVLVDFWASWCGPCLEEAPNVKAIYEDYKDKGFEVYGVSLDTDKAAWEKAIEQNGLNWIHVSSLKGVDAATTAYNVTGVPCMYLLDKEGRIIAKNLRGQALRDKVASLFDNH